ncbi:MAG: hypothetical protein WD645_00050, partial [Dehalococcoidia bacterium]
EIMVPGTYEYAERVAERDQEVNFQWLVASQPVINIFNREAPYWWVFDPLVAAGEWVREPPARAIVIPELNIEHMNTPARFPPASGRRLYSVVGLRTAESRGRMYGLFSARSHITKPKPPFGVSSVWPIYDWSDADIWHAIHLHGWDYNRAYDVMVRYGVPARQMRIGPPTINVHAAGQLARLHTAWPRWFTRVCHRLPGVRTLAQFGIRAVQPVRRVGESWRETFERECVREAPSWIGERAGHLRDAVLSSHTHHSTTPLPETAPCYHCQSNIGSWRAMAQAMYCGDAFSTKQTILPYVEPEAFRAGAGRWGGQPSW